MSEFSNSDNPITIHRITLFTPVFFANTLSTNCPNISATRLLIHLSKQLFEFEQYDQRTQIHRTKKIIRTTRLFVRKPSSHKPIAHLKPWEKQPFLMLKTKCLQLKFIRYHHFIRRRKNKFLQCGKN